jgi:GNAT superfamily N-acetyltransferase
VTHRPDVTLRPATGDDADYVDSLVLADALVELAALPDPPRSHLARVQVAARREGCSAAWPGAVDHLILLGGVRVGRLLLHHGDATVHVVDIRLEADERRQGVGTAALGQVSADASLAGATVTLSVRAGTPTEQWYRRLGFLDAGAPDPQAADVDLVKAPDR